ncbi:PadR family transcriptional regulator [Loigolactobacillus iwatensis]|uniref:PadR family transcriptional regulator n=1 Tax=Loigolactobacillus iwatensis TaxID=1267156 RepID=UPI000F7F80F1|nr:PadR family transcriptional regulator [Loigolactobacillus iwatensis]
MYELLILGILRTHKMSGYKLGQVLESSLVPRRVISNGVMYPLLNRLTKQGYIEEIASRDESRNKKMMQITELGKQRFQELMLLPVAMDAKRESIYRFKFRGMSGVDIATQRAILNEYATATQTDLDVYRHFQAHLQAQLTNEEPTIAASFEAGLRALDLSIAICKTTQGWIKQYQADLKQKENLNATE